MVKTIRNAGVDNERSHIWRNIAGKRTEIAKTRMDDTARCPRGLRPSNRDELPRRIRCRLLIDFAGDDGFRGAAGNGYIALDDVVKRDGPRTLCCPRTIVWRRSRRSANLLAATKSLV